MATVRNSAQTPSHQTNLKKHCEFFENARINMRLDGIFIPLWSNKVFYQ